MAQKRKRNKKLISRTLMVLLFIAAIVVVYLVWDNYFNDNKSRESDDIEQVEEDEDKKTEETMTDDAVRVDDEKKVVQYEGEDPNKKDELSGSVTYAGFINSKAAIRVNIDQFLSEGNCELSIIGNGEVIYSEDANIVSSASTSTCEGFDFVSPKITSGKYDVVIKITSGEKSGTINGVLEV